MDETNTQTQTQNEKKKAGRPVTAPEPYKSLAAANGGMKKLAEKLEISYTQLYAISRGKQTPSPELQAKIDALPK